MFLWMRLVLESLDSIDSPEDLSNIVDDLPSDLNSLYIRIFDRLCGVGGSQRYGGVPRVVSWMLRSEAFAQAGIASRNFN